MIEEHADINEIERASNRRRWIVRIGRHIGHACAKDAESGGESDGIIGAEHRGMATRTKACDTESGGNALCKAQGLSIAGFDALKDCERASITALRSAFEGQGIPFRRERLDRSRSGP